MVRCCLGEWAQVAGLVKLRRLERRLWVPVHTFNHSATAPGHWTYLKNEARRVACQRGAQGCGFDSRGGKFAFFCSLSPRLWCYVLFVLYLSLVCAGWVFNYCKVSGYIIGFLWNFLFRNWAHWGQYLLKTCCIFCTIMNYWLLIVLSNFFSQASPTCQENKHVQFFAESLPPMQFQTLSKIYIFRFQRSVSKRS